MLSTATNLQLLKQCLPLTPHIRSYSLAVPPHLLRDSDLYAFLLQSCTWNKDIKTGGAIHGRVIKSGFENQVFVCNNLLNLYTKFCDISDASRLFERMQERSIVSWNTMIGAHLQRKEETKATHLLRQMLRAENKPNAFTLSSIFQGFEGSAALEKARQLQALTLKLGLILDLFVGSSIINMYSKCDCLADAKGIFEELPARDIVTWSTIIAAYADSEQVMEALRIFGKMRHEEMAPNHFSFSSVLKACAGLKTLDASKQIHCLSIKTGFCLDLVVGNALVDAYSKCEYMDEAWRVFDEMPNKDEISWTTLIVGYSQNCMGNEALSAFKLLRNRGVDPDQYMLASVISGCGAITSEIHGRQLHSYSIKVGFGSSLFVQNALVDMYSKNGSIKSAHKVFGFMENRDVVSWTSLIVGLAQHGMGEKALFLFDQMRMAHVKPNHVTFVGVLSACSHVGLVDKGLFYFELMSKDYGIEPGYDHFVCMVDLLGRVGNLEEAKKFIDELPIPPGPLVWQTFLGACKLHGNVKLGKLAATHVLELSPHDSSVYVLLSNMHAEAGLWEEAARVRNMMRERGARKEVAYSWIEVRRKVHKFVVRESMHPEVEEINELLKVLLRHMEVDGYAHNGQSALRGDAE